MKSKIIFLVLAIFLITFTSAQLGYNNPKLPRIEAPQVIPSSINNNSVNVNNSNCWKGDCGGFRNPFNQDLNTTSNVVFNNLTVNGQSYFSKLGTFDVDLSDPALKWVRFTGFGGTVEAANLNFGLGAFVFQAANNFALYFGNDNLSALLSILDTGYIELGGTGVFMRDATARWFETNLSRTTIYNNLSLPNNLDDYWDGDCPSGNYTYGINNNGSLKCSSPLNPIRNIYKSENISTNVTGLTFNTLYTIPLESNTNYTIDCYIRRSSNATTSGIRYNMSLAGTPDWMTVTQTGYTTTTATIQNNIAGATRSLMPTAIATSIAYPTFSLDTINIFIDGNSATSGNAVFQFSGELANLRAVVGRGSYCKPEVVI